MTMSRTKNKWREATENSSIYKHHKKRGLNRKLRQASKGISELSIIKCDPDTPWKYGKPERYSQTDRRKGAKRISNKHFRQFLKNDALREIKEDLEE